jgi:hypothetical protein
LAQTWALRPIKVVDNRAGAGSNIGDKATAKDIAPVKDVKEFIAYSKTRPEKLTYGSPSNGSSPHPAGEMFKDMTQSFLLHVLYRSATLAVVPHVPTLNEADFRNFDADVGLPAKILNTQAMKDMIALLGERGNADDARSLWDEGA